MSWISRADDRQSTISTLPEIAEPFFALYRSLWNQPHLPVETLELCRLRLAQLHRCDLELQRCEIELPDEKSLGLARWESGKQFSAAERACLAFTEVYAMDAQALTDEHAEAVKSHVGDEGLVLLVEALGILDGMTRLSLLWQLTGSGQSVKRGGEPQ
jgi:alkylhydroperoxidase family enzyme